MFEKDFKELMLFFVYCIVMVVGNKVIWEIVKIKEFGVGDLFKMG